MSANDPQHIACESFKGQGLDHVNMDLVEPLPPDIVKDEPNAFNEDYLSHCCRFTQSIVSLPPLSCFEIDVDMDLSTWTKMLLNFANFLQMPPS